MAKQFNFDTPNTAFAEMFSISGKTQEIALDELVIISNQPFRVYTEARLQELATDIKSNGLLSPLVVRPKSEKYQVLSGRNRYYACKMLGMSTVDCIVRDVGDIEAELILLNANLCQRHELSITEKALAYRRQFELQKELGKGSEFVSASEMSRATTYRYIQLGNLDKRLLTLLDEGKLKVQDGLDISYLPKTAQDDIYIQMLNHMCKIPPKTAGQLKKVYEQNNFIATEDIARAFDVQSKMHNQAKKIVLKVEDLAEIWEDVEYLNETIIKNRIVDLIKKYGGRI